MIVRPCPQAPLDREGAELGRFIQGYILVDQSKNSNLKNNGEGKEYVFIANCSQRMFNPFCVWSARRPNKAAILQTIEWN
jgi:hypothetical protein